MNEVEPADTAPDSTPGHRGDDGPNIDGPNVDDGGGETAPAADRREPLDLERIETDLAGVEAALRRLDDGTYWTDEVTGEPIPDEVLAADPVARRVR